MEESSSDEMESKRLWTEKTSKILIDVFKKYYEMWKNGNIDKKNRMWQKIGAELRKRGLNCTPNQAENRYKTLLRRYRKAYGIHPGRNGLRSNNIIENFTDGFIENIGFTRVVPDDENEGIIITNQEEGCQQFLDESTGSIFTLAPEMVIPRKRARQTDTNQIFQTTDDEEEEDEEEEEEMEQEELPTNLEEKIEKIIKSNEKILKKTRFDRTKINATRRKVVSNTTAATTTTPKTNVDVLLEMKELFKKIEIRRQARHEQNLRVAKERNELLRRKNELLESLLANQTN